MWFSFNVEGLCKTTTVFGLFDDRIIVHKFAIGTSNTTSKFFNPDSLSKHTALIFEILLRFTILTKAGKTLKYMCMYVRVCVCVCVWIYVSVS